MARRDPGKSRRAKGKRARLKILQATLAIIAREGILGVNHRAVAAEADVHLSLTTYYCSDIEELPQEAFLQICEQIRPAIDSLRADLLPYLDGISAADLRRVATREAVVDKLANHASDYIFTQTT